MDFFGLDIGSYSLKAAQVRRDKSGLLRLVALGRAPTPIKNMASEADSDLAEVASGIKKLLQESKISSDKVVFALPESEVATVTKTFPKMSEDELSAAIKFEAEAFVPFPLNQANLDFQIVSSNEKEMEVMVVAAPQSVVNKYLKVISLAGLEAIAIETEAVALARSIVPSDSPPCLVVDFGAKTCDLAAVWHEAVIFTRSISTAGEAFTRALSLTLGLEAQQAEEYKRNFGLTSDFEGKIQKSLLPLLDAVASEMSKAIQFSKQEKGADIARVFLSGGTAGLPAMAVNLAERLGIEVVVADPFGKLTFEKKDFLGLTEEGAIFSIALGLAQREL